MTLKEKALKYLESSKINDPQHDLEAISEIMAEFSRIQTKAKLEEAAESAQIMVLDDHDDVWEVVTEINLYGGYRVIVDYQGIVKTKLD